MKFLYIIIPIVIAAVVTLWCSSCTYNVSMAHTEGVATDVIDDNMSNAPTADINLPTVP